MKDMLFFDIIDEGCARGLDNEYVWISRIKVMRGKDGKRAERVIELPHSNSEFFPTERAAMNRHELCKLIDKLLED